MGSARYVPVLSAGVLLFGLIGCGESAELTAPEDATERRTAATTPTVATDLGPADEGAGCSFEGPHSSAAFDINTAGTVVGETDCIASETLTFRWSEAAGMEFLANFTGGYGTRAGSINAAGNIAALFSTNNSLYDLHPIIWTSSNSRIDLIEVTSCDPDVNPGTECSTGSNAHYINDRNEVTGIHDDAPYFWSRATGFRRLPALEGWTPVAINRKGDIAATDFSNSVIQLKNGQQIRVDGLWALGMNDKRQLVGATGGFPPESEAAVWTKAKGIRNLGTLGGDQSIANGINNRGEVVGASTNTAGEMRAFYWTQASGMVDLGRGIANAISDEGDIVGLAPAGFFGEFEIWHATLWRGTGGVSAAVSARAVRMASPRSSACYASADAWRSKAEMFRCLSNRE